VVVQLLELPLVLEAQALRAVPPMATSEAQPPPDPVFHSTLRLRGWSAPSTDRCWRGTSARPRRAPCPATSCVQSSWLPPGFRCSAPSPRPSLST